LNDRSDAFESFECFEDLPDGRERFGAKEKGREVNLLAMFNL